MARRLILPALSLAFMVASLAPAQADPIFTPIITALLTAAAFPTTVSVLGASISIASVLSGLLVAGIGIVLTSLLTPKPKTPTPESGLVAVQQTIPYRIFGFGIAPCAGAVMLKEEIGGWLVYVAAISGHPVESIEALFLNDDPVTVPPNGLMLKGYVAGQADGRYGSSIVYDTLTIDTRLGASTETYYDFISALVPSQWTTAHRGDTCASLAMTCAPIDAKYFGTIYPYGAPQPRPVVKWALVYDWRDNTQVLATPSTWKWSQNNALHISHWLCNSTFGFQENFTNAIAPFLSEWTQAANDCDDAMALKAGGTEPRYQSGGFGTAESSISSTLLTLLQSCDGHLVKFGGAYRLKVGKYQAPTITITDDDIVGVYFQNGQITEQKVNEATAKYTSPDCGYITVDTDPVIDTSDQAIRPGAPRKAQLDLAWVQSPGRASRLLKREMIRQKEPLRGKLTLKWSGMNACFERWIEVQSNSIQRLANVVIENTKSVISAKTMRIEIDFIGSGPQIDTYDPSNDETTHPTVPSRPTAVNAPVPTSLSAVGELLTDPSSGAATVVLNISWDQPIFNGAPWLGLTFLAQYRLHDAGGGIPGPWVSLGALTPSLSGSTYSAQTVPVPSSELDVQMQATGSGTSAWSPSDTISTNYPDLAPLPPTWISATGSSGHAALSVTSPYSANFYAVQFYRALSGNPFGSATAIGSPVTGAVNSTISYTDTVAAGTYDYFAVSETSLPVSSSPVGPETATVT